MREKMKWDEVFCNTFAALRKQTGPSVRRQLDFMLPSLPMVEACRADDFDFFHPFITAGKLTVGQMHRACERYCLGKTKTGRPMYWMIDDRLTPLDAHIGDTWLSSLLKDREPLLSYWHATHCLFGLHLSGDEGKPISIVEREETAVVLSELFPESLWMAYATTAHLSPELFAPLEGRIVTIYPRTDPTMSTYLFFRDLIELTRKQYDIDMSVETILEDNASEAQKDRCIDILDYLLESL